MHNKFDQQFHIGITIFSDPNVKSLNSGLRIQTLLFVHIRIGQNSNSQTYHLSKPEHALIIAIQKG